MSKFLYSLLTIFALTTPLLSQSTNLPNGSNAALPVEATADDLLVNTHENSAVFSGNAKVIQGVLDLRANEITVFFEEGDRNIKTVKAIGQVKFSNGQATAEAQNAKFDVASQIITFTGNVILRQTQTVLSGNLLTYNITTSRSKMSGNVKTVFIPK